MKRLILGVSDAVGLSTLRVLQRTEGEVVVADTLRVAQGLYRDGVDAHLLEDDSVDTVLELVDRTDVDVVFVSDRQLARRLAHRGDDLRRMGAALALPDADVVRTLLDKGALAETFPDLTPRRYEPDDPLQFPVVIRDRIERLEGGVPVIENRDRFDHELRRLKRQGVDPVVQEHVGGDEYLVWLVYDETTTPVLATALAVRDKTWNFLGNIGSLATTDDTDMVELGREVGDRLGIRNAHLELLFREPTPGTYVLVSASPLLGELQSAAVAAGHNHAETLARVAAGGSVEPPGEYETGVRAVRNTVYQGVEREALL